MFTEGWMALPQTKKVAFLTVTSLAWTITAGKDTAVVYISCQLRHEYYFAPNTIEDGLLADPCNEIKGLGQ